MFFRAIDAGQAASADLSESTERERPRALVLAVMVTMLFGWTHSPALAAGDAGQSAPGWTRSAQSGFWSAPATWEGGKVPAAGARVQVRTGHTVVYDHQSDLAIRVIHVAGTLRFATDRDTRLDVGLIKIQPGDEASEDGFNCDAHIPEKGATGALPALEVGASDRPLPAQHRAVIRLVYIDGMDRESCPAIVCC